MPAFVVGCVEEVHDPERFLAYQQKAGPTLAPFGGRVVAGGSNMELADGEWLPAGLLVLEFPSMATAKAWYESPAYRNARTDRLESSTSSMVFLDMGQ